MIWNTCTYRLVLKISAETGAKGRERKNQCKKKTNLNNKTIANKEKNVNIYFYKHGGGGGGIWKNSYLTLLE